MRTIGFNIMLLALACVLYGIGNISSGDGIRNFLTVYQFPGLVIALFSDQSPLVMFMGYFYLAVMYLLAITFVLFNTLLIQNIVRIYLLGKGQQDGVAVGKNSWERLTDKLDDIIDLQFNGGGGGNNITGHVIRAVILVPIVISISSIPLNLNYSMSSVPSMGQSDDRLSRLEEEVKAVRLANEELKTRLEENLKVQELVKNNQGQIGTHLKVISELVTANNSGINKRNDIELLKLKESSKGVKLDLLP